VGEENPIIQSRKLQDYGINGAEDGKIAVLETGLIKSKPGKAGRGWKN